MQSRPGRSASRTAESSSSSRGDRPARVKRARAGGAIDWIARRGVKRGGAVNALLFLIRTADLADE